MSKAKKSAIPQSPVEKTKKHPGGRPSKYNNKTIIEIAERLYRAGNTDKQVASILGVTEKTINEWKKNHKEFRASLKNWKDGADEKVERSLYERACGYTHPEEQIFQFQGKIIRANTNKLYPPDPTSMIFWLKNRNPEQWRDKVEHEHSGNVTINRVVFGGKA